MAHVARNVGLASDGSTTYQPNTCWVPKKPVQGTSQRECTQANDDTAFTTNAATAPYSMGSAASSNPSACGSRAAAAKDVGTTAPNTTRRVVSEQIGMLRSHRLRVDVHGSFLSSRLFLALTIFLVFRPRVATSSIDEKESAVEHESYWRPAHYSEWGVHFERLSVGCSVRDAASHCESTVGAVHVGIFASASHSVCPFSMVFLFF